MTRSGRLDEGTPAPVRAWPDASDSTSVESVIPGVRRQQGVQRRVWIGVDASHGDRGPSAQARGDGAARWHRNQSREPGTSHCAVLLVPEHTSTGIMPRAHDALGRHSRR